MGEQCGREREPQGGVARRMREREELLQLPLHHQQGEALLPGGRGEPEDGEVPAASQPASQPASHPSSLDPCSAIAGSR